MADYAKVIVGKDALGSLREIVDAGREVLERKLLACSNRMREFEEKTGMDTGTFVRRFESGDIGDGREWMEWDHLASVSRSLKKKYMILRESDMNIEDRLKNIRIALRIADWFSSEERVDYMIRISRQSPCLPMAELSFLTHF